MRTAAAVDPMRVLLTGLACSEMLRSTRLMLPKLLADFDFSPRSLSPFFFAIVVIISAFFAQQCKCLKAPLNNQSFIKLKCV